MRAFLIGIVLALAAFGVMLFIIGKRTRENGATAYLSRGMAYDVKGDYRRAIADYDEVLRLVPNDQNAIKNRELALAQLAKTAQGPTAATSSPSN